MTGGEALAGIILRLTTMAHSILNGWVNVTNTAGDGGDQLGFSLSPSGVDFAHWTAQMVEAYAGLANALMEIPLLGVSIAKMLLFLMS